MRNSLERKKASDIALINLWEGEKVLSEKMHSKGKYTPFEDVTFNSVIDKVFLRGELLLQDY